MRPDKAPQRPGTNFDSNTAQSVEFVINSDSRVYQGVAPLETAE
jgi:hypothetical protein